MKKLSRQVRFLQDKPVVYTIGDMYFRLEMAPGSGYARVPSRGKRITVRRLAWWLLHLLRNTDAKGIEVLHPRPMRTA